MKDILLDDGNLRIECNIDGLKVDLIYSDEPSYHYMFTMRSPNSYNEFKRKVNEIFFSYDDENDGWRDINDYLQTHEIEEFFEKGSYVHRDLRTEDEIHKYLEEAWDKVWLMRHCFISTREPIHEASRRGMERILATYDDIPKDGYDTWECGYWNGIMGALRWVTGDDKNFLDT